MAADSRAWSGDKHPIGAKLKLRRLDNGTLVGCACTTPGGSEAVLDWYAAGHPDDHKLPDAYTMIAVEKNGDIYYSADSDFITGPLDAPFICIGSGEAYAQGACLMGADAIEAVRAACIADTFTDFPIYCASHRRKTMWRVDQ
jgi:hypothetical protein